MGICHEDFSADNILFHDNCLSAIIDFDRNHYNYLWHDIGRVILSFALKENHLDKGKVIGFIEGYTEHLPLTISNMIDALRLTWCIETPWWINPGNYYVKVNKVERFKEEMIWLTKHWFELDGILKT